MKQSKLGVRVNFLKAVNRIYRETWNEVITGEGITKRFKTRKGVRQGRPLSVILFIIYLEDLEERWVNL